MKTSQRILVALDMTAFDEKLLTYAKFLKKEYRESEIHLVHVSENLEFPAHIKPEYIDPEGHVIPKDELLKQNLGFTVNRVFNLEEDSVMIDILEGKPLDQLLHWAEVKDIDLILAGRKTLPGGSGVLPRQLLRRSKADLFLIAENSIPEFRNILVPVDFSEDSNFALETAIEFAKDAKDTEITCLHIFDVPLFNYYKINMTYEKYVENILEIKMDTFQNFIRSFKPNEISVRPVFMENQHINPARHIHEYALKNQPDLIITGAGGHSKLDLFLLGSVTEKLLTFHADTAVLVLKRKSTLLN